MLYSPTATAVDPAGNVFIADYNNCRIREINAATGIITTVAGNGNCNYTGDGIAIDNSVGYPQGVAVDANDNLFISEYYAPHTLGESEWSHDHDRRQRHRRIYRRRADWQLPPNYTNRQESRLMQQATF